MGRADHHFVFRSLSGGVRDCGDIGIIRDYDHYCFLGLVDALGHGKSAYDIACLACDYLEQHFSEDLVGVMKGLHAHLKGTRGCVAALCRLDVDTGDLFFVGVGNITVKILGPRAATLVPRDGVVGYLIPTPVEHRCCLQNGDTLVMYSDGIREHFNPLDHAGLWGGNARAIADGMLEQLGKKDDDASCIALRYYHT